MIVMSRYSSRTGASSHGSPFLDKVADATRARNYSPRTEQAYVDWVRRFIVFHGKRHPKDMGSDEIRAFITHLAVDLDVAAATQNQAIAGLKFMYRHVIDREIDDADIAGVRAKKPKRLPTVLHELTDGGQRPFDELAVIGNPLAVHHR